MVQRHRLNPIEERCTWQESQALQDLRFSLDPVEVEAEPYVVASFGAGSGMSGRKSRLMLIKSERIVTELGK